MATAAKSTVKKKEDTRKLVIVESPSKAKTIGKFLGSKYKVYASVGHIRDLPKSKLGINIENNFDPEYINIRGKADIINALKKEAKNSTGVLIATDPDREGEAISWHIAYLLGLSEESADRIEFNEITKDAIKKAVDNPRKIDMGLVDAQQARRVLDRLVGYQISPLLWRKISRGLSAGRVQSAALKIIVDREREIQAFVPVEYWNINAELQKKEGDTKSFTAKLNDIEGKKISISDKAQADSILADLAKGSFSVAGIEEKERTRKPFAPFTTSTLQQDAAAKLGFQTRKTMSVAQQLYEGINVKGSGTIGLITYIRTDSVRISAEADAAVKSFIKSEYGEDYLGNNFFSNKKKEVQDAHEAIRPSNINLRPDEIKDSLSPDQYKLYKLIWSRFVASRMSIAVYDSVICDIKNDKYGFRATGSKMRFDGFLKVYRTKYDDDDEKTLPALSAGEELNSINVDGVQSFTQPPPRFTEASLVKELEEKDIGRPSTYVPIISTLTDRRYVKREKKTLIPADLGFLVTELMEKYFGEIVDSGFTARMEDRLDDIETKRTEWHGVVSDFYSILKEELVIADKEIEKLVVEDVVTDEICENCGKPMLLKQGRFGEFLACSGYPECKTTKAIVKSTGVACPKCGKDIVQRKSRKGKIFYGCSGYPDCDMVFWYKPTNEKCPKCGSLLVERKGKDFKLACSSPDCDFRK